MLEYNNMSHVIYHGNADTFHSGTLMFFFLSLSGSMVGDGEYTNIH